MNSLKKDLFSKRMLIVFLLGFSSGLPFLLTGSTLKLWLKREGVDLSTIGYFGWVGMSYSLKFIWSPFVDRFSIFKHYRRKGWMILTQLLLGCSLIFMSTLNPHTDLSVVAIVAAVIAFLSATQDIVIDAYRRELLTDQELGLGSSLNIYGYRLAMLVSGGLGVSLVGSEWLSISWNQLYFLMAFAMLIGLITTLLAPEPEEDQELKQTKGLIAILNPFIEFLKRDGAFYILAFVFLYKLGDAMAGALLNPYYADLGYSNEAIGVIAKTFGLFSTLGGSFLGGLAIYRYGIYRCLWAFGIMQALSTVSFMFLAHVDGHPNWALASVVLFEDVATSMAGAAFVAFLASLTHRRYTATQYAVLSSIATLGRNFFSGFSGDIIKHVGWDLFFIICGVMAAPGLMLLFKMKKYDHTNSKS